LVPTVLADSAKSRGRAAGLVDPEEMAAVVAKFADLRLPSQVISIPFRLWGNP